MGSYLTFPSNLLANSINSTFKIYPEFKWSVLLLPLRSKPPSSLPWTTAIASQLASRLHLQYSDAFAHYSTLSDLSETAVWPCHPSIQNLPLASHDIQNKIQSCHQAYLPYVILPGPPLLLHQLLPLLLSLFSTHMNLWLCLKHSQHSRTQGLWTRNWQYGMLFSQVSPWFPPLLLSAVCLKVTLSEKK